MIARRLLVPLLGAILVLLLPASASRTALAGLPNDNFGSSILITSPSTPDVVTAGNNIGSSFQSMEGQPCNMNQRTVWYHWNAPASNGTVIFDTVGSDYDTAIAVYTGAGLGSLMLEDCNDDWAGGGVTLNSGVVINYTASTTYRIQIGGYLNDANVGNIILNISHGTSMVVDDVADTNTSDGLLSLREAMLLAVGGTGGGGLGRLLSPQEQARILNDVDLGLEDLIHFDNEDFPPSTPAAITLGGTLPLVGVETNVSGVGAGVVLDGLLNFFDCVQMASFGFGNIIQGLQFKDCDDGIDMTLSDENRIGGTFLPSQRNVFQTSITGVRIANSDDNIVAGNYIGLDPTGTISNGNATGVYLSGAANNNVIGGPPPEARNVISGNTTGVWADAADNNFIRGNYIGTNAAGTAALGNLVGVQLTGNADSNIIGNASPAGDNFISGNLTTGVVIDGSNFNTVLGNFIGTDAVTGTTAVPNGTGVILQNLAAFNTIGSAIPGDPGGNIISGNTGDGLRIETGHSNSIQDNKIGTNATGTAALGNGGNGISLVNTGSNTIGGLPLSVGNVISGNSMNGVRMSGSSNNSIQGNFIGTNSTGNGAVPNLSSGIAIDSSVNNTIGGTGGGQRNYISGNDGPGISISNKSVLNTVQGNYIGTNASGTGALPNASTGVLVDGTSSANTVGGPAPGTRNVISGNTADGVRIAGGGGGVWRTGVSPAAVPIPDLMTVMSTVNVSQIATVLDVNVQLDITHTFDGDLDIFLIAPGGTEIELSTDNGIGGDNYTGTIFDDEEGLSITAGSPPFAAGYHPEGDLARLDGIPTNGDWTLRIADDSGGDFGTLNYWVIDLKTTGNQIQGNYIGTNAAGNAAIPNGNSGVQIDDGIENTIGGPTAGEGNLISGNSDYGAFIDGSFVSSASGVTYPSADVPKPIPDPGTVTSDIFVNGGGFVADVDVNLTIAHPFVTDLDIFLIPPFGPAIELSTDNGGDGDNYTNTTFDDDTAVVSITAGAPPYTGFYRPETPLYYLDGIPMAGLWTLQITDDDVADVGILLSWSLRLVIDGNRVLGNSIGVASGNASSLPNNTGVVLLNAPLNTIGGLGPQDANILSGNFISGVWGDGIGSSRNSIVGNWIGTNTVGGFLPNFTFGVLLSGSAANNDVSYNTIANNDSGVRASASGLDNQFHYNSIHSSTSLGIDLDIPGVTLNDTGDPDAGSNNLQNFPLVTSASTGGGSTTLGGTLNTTPLTTVALTFYHSPSCDPSGYGEGKTYIGNHINTTDGAGNLNFNSMFGFDIPVTSFVTATTTARAPGGGTSEFSACRAIPNGSSDDDHDGVTDTAETNCGADPLSPISRPERTDLLGDDDGDTLVNEALPGGAVSFDCDGDGFVGTSENHVFNPATNRDQDACGTNGWPLDLVSGPPTENEVDIVDLGRYIAPIRRLNTSPPNPNFNVRWDVIPGNGGFGEHINLVDLAAFVAGATGYPPMLFGARAFNGFCPWPP